MKVTCQKYTAKKPSDHSGFTERPKSVSRREQMRLSNEGQIMHSLLSSKISNLKKKKISIEGEETSSNFIIT